MSYFHGKKMPLKKKDAMRKEKKNAMRKYEKTKPAAQKDEILARKDEKKKKKKKKKKTPCRKTAIETLILSSFRVVSFRLEKTKWHIPATIARWLQFQCQGPIRFLTFDSFVILQSRFRKSFACR